MTYYYRTMSSVLQIAKTGYKCAIGASALGGFIYGSKEGFRNAKKICFVKKDLDMTEYSGEIMCYGIIIVSSAMTYTVLTSLYCSIFPLTFPLTYYIAQKD